MPLRKLFLQDNFFSADAGEMIRGAVSDLSIVAKRGTVRTNKMAFFGLLPSMRNLICGECNHADMVIIMPEEDIEDVEEAVSEMMDELKIDKVVSLLEGHNIPKNNYRRHYDTKDNFRCPTPGKNTSNESVSLNERNFKITIYFLY